MTSPAHIVEIQPSLEPSVRAYAASAIGRGIAADEFAAALHPPWNHGQKPSGYALLAGDQVVGLILTISARRTIRGRARNVCNFSSWAVDAQYRSYGIPLLVRALKEPETIYTNFTASAAVAKVLQTLKFQSISDRERILLPGSQILQRSAFSATADIDRIEQQLRERGADDIAGLVADHRNTRAVWIGATDGARQIAVAFHLMRVGRLRFAHFLYCSNDEALPAALGAIARAVRRAFGWHLIAWSDYQIRGGGPSIVVHRPRPILYRGVDVGPADLDGLYSELTLLPVLR